MSEIGNYYDAYRRSQRERASALNTLAEMKKREEEMERLAAEGKVKKVVTYDPKMRLTTTKYIHQ